MLLNCKLSVHLGRAGWCGARRVVNVLTLLFLFLCFPALGGAAPERAAEESRSMDGTGKEQFNSAFSKAAMSDLPLRVLFWPDYLPRWVYKEFTEKTGIKIIFDSYGNYESMYSQIKDHVGDFDLIQPSGEYAHLLWSEGLLKKIDFSRIPNYAHIDPFWKNTSIDPEELYCVPLFWGLTGFLINKNMINPDEVRDYPDLWKDDVASRLIVVNEPRTALSVSLKALGLSCNDLSPESRGKALAKMSELISKCSVRNLEDGLEDMENNQAALMVVWAPEGVEQMREHPHMVFVLPPTPLLWIDCLAMPVSGLATEQAEAFIDFLLDPAISVRVAKEVGYSTPNFTARKLLSKETRENPYLYPNAEVIAAAELESPLHDFAGELAAAWEVMIDKASRAKTTR